MSTPPADYMQQAPRELQELYQSALRGDLLAVRELFAHRPEMLRVFLQHYGTVGARLDRRTYEVVYLRISRLNGCSSCIQAHRESSKWVGLTPAHWQALDAGDHTMFDPKERAALRFAEKLAREPQKVDASDIAAVRKHLAPEQTVDLQLLVELANLASRLPDPLAADLKGPKARIPLE